MTQQQFPCGQCGATLEFKPGELALVCEYCGHSNPIEAAEAAVEELDYRAFLEDASAKEATEERLTVKCDGCGAESTLGPNIASDECPFCGSAIVTAQSTKKVLKPRSVLPFKVKRKEAFEAFQKWLRGLWFAPNALKQKARNEERIQGIYVPYWTYDADADTQYRGQRGTHYYVTQTYTTTVNGKSVTKTRQVRKTRWRNVSGHVDDKFDDLLVMAGKSMPEKLADALEPWDLNSLVPYKNEYLSGFKTETYHVTLAGGFDVAKVKMEPTIRDTVRRDIGGDEQRVNHMHSSYSKISFKHILLPVWLSSYRYEKKVYRFLVNARTGEVQGTRPYSWIKIALAVLFGLAVAGLIGGLIYYYQG